MANRQIEGYALSGIARTFGVGAQASDVWFEPFGLGVEDVMGGVLAKAAERLVPITAFAGHADPVVYPIEGEPLFELYASPAAEQGLAIILRADAGEAEAALVTLYPFMTDGEEHEVAVGEVLVSEDRSQGVVAGSVADQLPIAFHDVRFAVTRSAHAKGSVHFVRLSGIVHAIQKRSDEPVVLEAGSSAARRLRTLLRGAGDDEKAPSADEPLKLSTAGMASIVPIADELPTFYDVTGLVRSVHRYQYDVLDRAVWRMVVTVAELDGPRRGRNRGRFDLTLYATDLVLDAMDGPPAVGDDIAARVRMQGSVSFPNVHLMPSFDAIRR